MIWLEGLLWQILLLILLLLMWAGILGHGYAGNAKKGIPPALVTLGGYIAIATTLDDGGEVKDDKEGVAAAGAVAVLAGRGVGVDAGE